MPEDDLEKKTPPVAKKLDYEPKGEVGNLPGQSAEELYGRGSGNVLASLSESDDLGAFLERTGRDKTSCERTGT